MMYWILFIGVAVLSYVVQFSFQKKFAKASQVPLLNGMAGREVAVRMLADHGIRDVKVTSTPGQLTDNFNPTNKTVNLSESVYNQNTVAAAAVAAHECGHAVQHAQGYFPVKVRSALVPVVSLANRLVPF
ncbi:MAG: zinc metallopeptidase, partial [Bacteroidales bacterium]|nr:zinc metallopeptidase [Bacteroidales bacterium]